MLCILIPITIPSWFFWFKEILAKPKNEHYQTENQQHACQYSISSYHTGKQMDTSVYRCQKFFKLRIAMKC